MIAKAFGIFFGLVALYFILMYPDQIVGLLQVFVDGAHKSAHALHHLNLHTGKNN